MSFLTGLFFIVLLLLFTVVVLLLSKKVPKEAALVPIVFLIVGDAILVGLYYYGLVDIVENVKKFKVGIAGAFAVSSLGRAIYLLLNEK